MLILAAEPMQVTVESWALLSAAGTIAIAIGGAIKWFTNFLKEERVTREKRDDAIVTTFRSDLGNIVTQFSREVAEERTDRRKANSELNIVQVETIKTLTGMQSTLTTIQTTLITHGQRLEELHKKVSEEKK